MVLLTLLTSQSYLNSNNFFSVYAFLGKMLLRHNFVHNLKLGIMHTSENKEHFGSKYRFQINYCRVGIQRGFQ